MDARLLRALNADSAFRGPVINRENIGKTADELVALWNEEHPDGLVAVEEPVGG